MNEFLKSGRPVYVYHASSSRQKKIPSAYSVQAYFLCIFRQRARYAHTSLAFRISHLNTASFYYLQNHPAFLFFLPFFFVFVFLRKSHPAQLTLNPRLKASNANFNICVFSTLAWDGAPSRFSLAWLRCAGHTEMGWRLGCLRNVVWRTSVDLKLVCNDAVQSRGRDPVSASPPSSLRRATAHLKQTVSALRSRATTVG